MPRTALRPRCPALPLVGSGRAAASRPGAPRCRGGTARERRREEVGRKGEEAEALPGLREGRCAVLWPSHRETMRNNAQLHNITGIST